MIECLRALHRRDEQPPIDLAASTTHAEPVAFDAASEKGRPLSATTTVTTRRPLLPERHNPCLIAFLASSFTTNQRMVMCHDRIDDGEIALTHEFMGMTILADPSGATNRLTIRHMAGECARLPPRCVAGS